MDGNTTVFRVDGAPAPQGSKRHVGNGILVESSAATLKPWRERIAWTAREHHVPLHDGPVLVRLNFVMPRPRATPKRCTPAAVKRPDLDKLIRSVLDALTHIAWTDDSRVVSLHATKRLAEIAETPGLAIVIEELP
ncbi:RusA family crossover junction endodeoxyribonuclease [Rhodococcus jostii]|uniref:RusA family crossover junction endodeoxyribonuclease n=1 Tax=Rhodococcus jostii TaxID=132919 RepID=UPI0036436482